MEVIWFHSLFSKPTPCFPVSIKQTNKKAPSPSKGQLQASSPVDCFWNQKNPHSKKSGKYKKWLKCSVTIYSIKLKSHSFKSAHCSRNIFYLSMLSVFPAAIRLKHLQSFVLYKVSDPEIKDILSELAWYRLLGADGLIHFRPVYLIGL